MYTKYLAIGLVLFGAFFEFEGREEKLEAKFEGDITSLISGALFAIAGLIMRLT